MCMYVCMREEGRENEEGRGKEEGVRILYINDIEINTRGSALIVNNTSVKSPTLHFWIQLSKKRLLLLSILAKGSKLRIYSLMYAVVRLGMQMNVAGFQHVGFWHASFWLAT